MFNLYIHIFLSLWFFKNVCSVSHYCSYLFLSHHGEAIFFKKGKIIKKIVHSKNKPLCLTCLLKILTVNKLFAQKFLISYWVFVMLSFFCFFCCVFYLGCGFCGQMIPWRIRGVRTSVVVLVAADSLVAQ